MLLMAHQIKGVSANFLVSKNVRTTQWWIKQCVSFVSHASRNENNTQIKDTFVYTIHQQHIVQSALILHRLPTVYEGPQFEKDFRNFTQKWSEKTKTDIILPDSLIYTRNESNFLTKTADGRELVISPHTGDTQKTQLNEIKETGGAGDVDDSDNTNRVMQLLKRKMKKKQPAEETTVGTESNKTDKLEKKDLSTSSSEVLYLIVRYKHESVEFEKQWMFPFGNVRHGDSMSQTLQHIHRKQLGLPSVFLVGVCPVSYQRIGFVRNDKNGDVQGRKLFYYRGALTKDEHATFQVPENGCIQEYKWVPAHDLKGYLQSPYFKAVKHSIYLT